MRIAPDCSGIVALMRAIERAWNAENVKSYARLYSHDAEYLTRAGILWKGRKAIERGHTAAFRSDLKGSVLKIRIKQLPFLSAKNAVAHCSVELSEGARQRGRKIRAITHSSCEKAGLVGKLSRRERARFRLAENERLNFAASGYSFSGGSGTPIFERR